MSNLLNIEIAFLGKDEVKQALNIAEATALQRTLTNGAKKRFEASMKLSKIVASASDWFDTVTAKELMASSGITWKKEQFFEKSFGFQKAYAYRLIQASKVSDENVAKYVQHCDDLERQKIASERSIIGLLNWLKGDAEESEGSGTVLSLTWKQDEAKVSVKIDGSGTAKTKNTKEEIERAIAYLQQSLATVQTVAK